VPAAVLVAHPHPIVREGVKAVLRGDPNVRVVGETDCGTAALALAAERRPDLLIAPAHLPDFGGPEFAARLRAVEPAPRLLVLTDGPDSPAVGELLAAGVAGVVLQLSPAADLARAVRAVARGETYLDPVLAGGAVDRFLGRGDPADPGLSERESETLRLIALGYSNKEIAVKLVLSVKTVETYKARAMEKLGIRTRVDVVRFAVARGWLPASAAGP
jgi:DNA-binding NarL/FixJ family response regulator